MINKINIIQFGCGGTGSYLFPNIIRFLSNITNRRRDDSVYYTICDDDIVERRNLLRQNFFLPNIGRAKTDSLILNNYLFDFKTIRFDFKVFKTRFKSITSLNKIIMNRRYYTSCIQDLMILIGCVDNNKSRRTIYKWIKKYDGSHSIVYLDSGNNLHNGQIVCTINDSARELFSNGEMFENIDFLKFFKLKDDKIEGESCAFFGDQSQSINLLASTLLFCNIQKMIIEELLPPNLITFNSSGFVNFQL